MKLYDIFGIGGNALGFGGGGTILPSLTDSGVLVTSISPIVLPDSASGSVLTIQRSGAASTGFYMTSTSTGLVNQTNGWMTISNTGAAGVQVPSTGGFGISSSTTIASAASDVFLGRIAAANWQLGKAASASPISYIINIGESSRGGTDTNVTGGTGTIRAGIGTGNAAGGKLVLQRGLMGASGTTAQSQVDAIVIGESKTLSNTSATATSLATISVPSNSGGGCSGFITVVASDGTNFDAETQSFNVSYVNKAGVLTIGTPAITASTAASNSGSTTIGLTVVAGTNSVDVKVTPVFTTIVPTTVTAFIEIHNHGTGNVTIN